MNPRKLQNLFIMSAASALLSGCVAAVIPLAAGAAMGGSLRNGSNTDGDSAQAETALTEASDAVVPIESLPALASSDAGGHTNPATGENTNANSIDLAQPGQAKASLLPLTELPPPSGATDNGQDELARFRDYALAQAALDPSETERQSAILAAPATLQLERKACGELPPAVLIDIDPGKKTADPFAEITLPRELIPILKTFRENDIRIAWISRMGMNFVEKLRVEFDKSDFDRAWQDIVLAPNTLDERKQTLRNALAEQYCIVAMLGDKRYDFDELYLYLKNEDAAFALERMIGDGWFLLPSPQASAEPAQDAPLTTETGDQ